MNAPPMLQNILAQPRSHQSLLELHAADGHRSLRACAELLRRAQGTVIFSGMGASLFATLPAVTALEQHGHRVQAIESSELLHYGSSTLRRGDLGVLISRSGGSIEVLLLAEKMRAAGMTLIGVTNMPDTQLERAVDLTLRIGSLSDQLIAVQTYTGTVLTLLLLAEHVLGQDFAEFSDRCLKSLPALSSYIEASHRASEFWQDLLTGGGPLYLLGRGPALASVREGALLLHETAKAPAVGISSGQFRHGPVEVVSGDFRAVIFGAPAPTRELEWSLASDLVRMGAKIGWVGPSASADGSGEQVPPLAPWPEIPSVLAPIFEIVPLQFAAYRLALWRGITPGDFRYASEVTSAETGFPLLQPKTSTA